MESKSAFLKKKRKNTLLKQYFSGNKKYYKVDFITKNTEQVIKQLTVVCQLSGNNPRIVIVLEIEH